MQRKIDQNRVARGLAINNRARSFMNLYQQQSEYEARLKVLRLERDISKYDQARVDFKVIKYFQRSNFKYNNVTKKKLF